MTTLKADKLFAFNMINDRRIAGFAEAIGVAFNNVGGVIDDLNIYDLENCPEEVLDVYAEMKKIRGYEYCANATQKRALAKLGVLLKRRGGTVYAVKTILTTLGFANVIIWENVDPAGSVKADGTFKANGWVKSNGSLLYDTYFFEVSADNMTGNEEKARNLIYHYKDAKSYLFRVFNN